MLTLNEILSKTGHRKDGFELMINHLKSIVNPFIVETGCARIENNIAGDGWSTVLWDRYITEYNGHAVSVDITPEHVSFAKSKVQKIDIVLGDSVTFLHQLSKASTDIDLLYLDSYDYTPGLAHESAMHHMYELSCINSKLKPGALVAVDDCWMRNGVREGKGKYVFEFMKQINKEIVYDGYQIIWRW